MPRRGRAAVAALAFACALAVLAGASDARAATPMTYQVDSTVDQADMNPGDGVCSTGAFGGNKCTLRAAILEANAHPGADTIEFTVPGPFALGVPVVNDDTPATGDFDIMAPLTIRGNVLLGEPGGTAVSAPSGFGYREWTVTTHVIGMYTPGANNGILVRDAAENGGGFDQAFNSREKGADNPPQLVISFD